jgi:2-desacetyl-2-hydroxyethyl bacteriochlorophyllide A dehydrogenase
LSRAHTLARTISLKHIDVYFKVQVVKALRLLQPGRPLELHEVSVPRPGAQEVRVKVKAAGICHSDAHYRAGRSPVSSLPITLGHEVAGVVDELGGEVTNFSRGDRVCLHYLATCGICNYCREGNEQFCGSVAMMGRHCDGGFAEYVVMPARSVFLLPDQIPFAHGAILMCSAATSLHALRKARLKRGECVAIFGVGGLGSSAIQLARALGASEVFAVDIQPAKLDLAQTFGAIPVNAHQRDPVQEIMRLTSGRGVAVALELIGLPVTMQQAVRCLAVQGRAALAGITERPFEVFPYAELINKEAEIIGVSDHLAQELPELLDFVQKQRLDLTSIVTCRLPLEAEAINAALDQLEQFGSEIRTVIEP